ncbi:hypothetical protein GCM10010430_68260 [Kitasatospora cystarginea]|uniref:Uncharacterized protein n=1 Tax=Kitasatospora cystarginea TaxID=58350 RepID=A0ABN3EW35_9ACTN
MPAYTPLAATGAPSGSARTSQLDVASELLALLRDATTEPRPDTQLEALTLAVAADLPVLLWGEPGIGKTAALTQLAAALDLPLTTVIASVHEPSDFSGLPIVGDDPATHGVPMAPPDRAVRLVRAGRGLPARLGTRGRHRTGSRCSVRPRRMGSHPPEGHVRGQGLPRGSWVPDRCERPEAPVRRSSVRWSLTPTRLLFR